MGSPAQKKQNVLAFWSEFHFPPSLLFLPRLFYCSKKSKKNIKTSFLSAQKFAKFLLQEKKTKIEQWNALGVPPEHSSSTEPCACTMYFERLKELLEKKEKSVK